MANSLVPMSKRMIRKGSCHTCSSYWRSSRVALQEQANYYQSSKEANKPRVLLTDAEHITAFTQENRQKSKGIRKRSRSSPKPSAAMANSPLERHPKVSQLIPTHDQRGTYHQAPVQLPVEAWDSLQVNQPRNQQPSINQPT